MGSLRHRPVSLPTVEDEALERALCAELSAQGIALSPDGSRLEPAEALQAPLCANEGETAGWR